MSQLTAVQKRRAGHRARLAVSPAQAAQAVLKTYFQAWRNCWDLNLVRVHRRWGMVNFPKLGRVRFRWTRDLPVGKRADMEHRVTGARLVKDALGWPIGCGSNAGANA